MGKASSRFPKFARPTEEEAREARDALAGLHGEYENSNDRSVVDSLVSTMLSQNTTDITSARAFAQLKEAFPDLWLHALSPPEIEHIRRASRISLAETLTRLRAAGLDSIPGGGAEILVDEIREQLATNKCSSAEWQTHA